MRCGRSLFRSVTNLVSFNDIYEIPFEVSMPHTFFLSASSGKSSVSFLMSLAMALSLR